MLFPDIDTPGVLIDRDVVEQNIGRYQAYCNSHGLGLRPHIKTHKIPEFARLQIAAGSIGITCQKIGEAEVMADAGIDDILITYNIIGTAKLKRLKSLSRRVKLSVVADNMVVIKGLSEAFQNAESPVKVLVECDTGAARCGVMKPAQAVDLALQIDSSPGLKFHGLMTYPANGGTQDVQVWMSEALKKCASLDLECRTISSGGSPDMWRAHEAPVVTEYRIGTYIYNDRSLVERGVCGWDDCALSVLATVISTPDKNRAVIDAGSKVLTTDLFGQQGFGHVRGRDDLNVYALSEEHGLLSSDTEAVNLKVGDRLQIIPNHCCVVSNMVDSVILHRAGNELQECRVAARGCVR